MRNPHLRLGILAIICAAGCGSQEENAGFGTKNNRSARVMSLVGTVTQTVTVTATETETATATATQTQTTTATDTTTETSTVTATATALIPSTITVTDTRTGTFTATNTTTVTSTNTTTTWEAETLCNQGKCSASSNGWEIMNDGTATYVQFTQNGCPAVGNYLEFTLANLSAGTYEIKYTYKSNNNRGKAQASIDGLALGSTCDQYAASPAYGVVCTVGSKALTAGNHNLRVTVTGKNPSASSPYYYLTVDKITVKKTSGMETVTVTGTETYTRTETSTDSGTDTQTLCSDTTYQAELVNHQSGSSYWGFFPRIAWGLWDNNAYLYKNHNFSPGPTKITVVAGGPTSQGVYPHMVVSVGGVTVLSTYTTSVGLSSYPVIFTATGGSQEIRITFDNDLNVGGEDRNLVVDYFKVECEPGFGTSTTTTTVTNTSTIPTTVTSTATATETVTSTSTVTQTATFTSTATATFGEYGESCTQNGDCASGACSATALMCEVADNDCANGSYYDIPFTTSLAVPPGTACPAGLFPTFQFYLPNNQIGGMCCASWGPNSCIYSTDCPSGKVCAQGYCKGNYGAACTQNSDCASGACSQTALVCEGNTPPTAQAGADQSVPAGSGVTLDASGSSDADGDPLAFTWSQIAGPEVQLSDVHAAKPAFTAPVVSATTTVTFQVMVSDGQAQTSDTVTVTVLI